MSTLSRFTDAIAAAEASGTMGAELLPERLAMACLAALPVDGAGMSVLFAPDRRLPLGASSAMAADAERLQFTVGAGPCLAAAATRAPVLASEAELASRWPGFHAGLVENTDYRSVASLPLAGGLAGIGTVDLYLTPPHGLDEIGLGDALAVVGEISSVFTGAMAHASRGAETPAWLDAPPAGRRAQVWVAIGVLNAELGVTSPQALSLLRASAYAADLDVDQLAAEVVSGRRSAEDLRPVGDLPD
ncbi:GAF domain-containing protein [Modestobacter sp. Leaf380]|uniref:GAF domain-containing protein n=1 Tax=Modestobacter sp. Leaf380 TaxID=1736356 RepID=UPI0007003355|nr:GAF domain-containing protein [Modestobacter sp. Leaf380]KQS66930.1 hypothetical protein ASG41_11145 [Modestobacter sp. Leaf380]